MSEDTSKSVAELNMEALQQEENILQEEKHELEERIARIYTARMFIRKLQTLVNAGG